MKPLPLILLMLLVTGAATSLQAEGCAPTPEAAAQGAFGAERTVATGAGYRVQDVQVDTVMRRVFVRVGRCDQPSAPLVLVPLQAPLQAAGLQAPRVATSTLSAASVTALTATVKVAAVHAGDAVRVVFASSAVQMELEGTVRQQAALGDAVEVVLKRRSNAAPDEPEHRMRGVLRAGNTVEVQ